MTAAREAISYYEAGHAIVSMRLGYRCLYVTIMPEGDRLGTRLLRGPSGWRKRRQDQTCLQVLIAASIAENKHIGSRTWGDADDRVKVTNLALLAKA